MQSRSWSFATFCNPRSSLPSRCTSSVTRTRTNRRSRAAHARHRHRRRAGATRQQRSAYSHLLGETGVGSFGSKALAARYERGFPGSLTGAPLLLPLDQLTLRRSLNAWIDRRRIAPRVVGEFEDSALMTEFAANGAGLPAAPSIVGRQLSRRYGLQRLGAAGGVRERFYAISIERRIAHPAVVALRAAARDELFASDSRDAGGQASGESA